MTSRQLPDTFGDLLRQLKVLSGAEARELAERYVAAHSGRFPIIEGETAHFVAWERPGKIIGIAGEWMGGDGRKGRMEPIGGGLLHYQHDFEPDVRLDYSIYEVQARYRDMLTEPYVADRLMHRQRPDPLNARTGEAGFGLKSAVEMPEYRRPEITLPSPGTPQGELRDEVIESEVLGHHRFYIVYLPSGYDPDGAPYPSIYFHDGTDYLTMGEAPQILDNLIAAGEIPPLVAVFVPPIRREDEYNCNDDYVRFFDEELIPALHEKYNLADDPLRRAVVGPSMGGIISLYMGHKLPHRFRLVGAQSTVVHKLGEERGFDAREDYERPPNGFRLHLVIGSYEGCFSTDHEGNCRDLLTPVQELRDKLGERGYTLRYVEQHQGHSWGMWRDTLPDALTFLYGT